MFQLANIATKIVPIFYIRSFIFVPVQITAHCIAPQNCSGNVIICVRYFQIEEFVKRPRLFQTFLLKAFESKIELPFFAR